MVASALVRLGRTRNPKAVLTITENAANRLRQLMSSKPPASVGFRLGLKKRGCTGESYDLGFTDNISKYDEVVKHNDVTVVVDSGALLGIIGSEMDYVENLAKSEFVFTNPNASAVCACGSSFTTAKIDA